MEGMATATCRFRDLESREGRDFFLGGIRAAWGGVGRCGCRVSETE